MLKSDLKDKAVINFLRALTNGSSIRPYQVSYSPQDVVSQNYGLFMNKLETQSFISKDENPVFLLG